MKTKVMKTSDGIFISLAVVICVLLLVWQGKKVSDLKAEVVREREAVVAIREAETKSGHQGESGSDPEKGSDPVAEAQQVSPTTVSELLAILPDESSDKGTAGFVRLLPEILALLEDFSVDELFELLEELSEVSEDASNAETNAGALAGVLVLILSDVEPLRTLTFLEEAKKGPGVQAEMESSALVSLAQQDPKKAEAFLKSADWRGLQKQQGELAVFGGWVQVDFKEALRYLKESNLEASTGISVLANAGRDPRVRIQMKKAIEEMEDLPMKRKFSTALLGAEYTDEGYEGVSQLLSQMTFATPEERDQALSGAGNMGLFEKPKETIEWLKEEASPARRGEFLTNSVMSWARQDYQAAGEWLMSQEPSSDTDQMISGYAATVVQIDPAAAMTWSGEIQDEKVQERTRKSSLREWYRADPTAARNWVVEQGWEVEDWLPNSN